MSAEVITSRFEESGIRFGLNSRLSYEQPLYFSELEERAIGDRCEHPEQMEARSPFSLTE